MKESIRKKLKLGGYLSAVFNTTEDKGNGVKLSDLGKLQIDAFNDEVARVVIRSMALGVTGTMVTQIKKDTYCNFGKRYMVGDSLLIDLVHLKPYAPIEAYPIF